MRNLFLFCVIVSSISSGYAQYGYFYPLHNTDDSWKWDSEETNYISNDYPKTPTYFSDTEDAENNKYNRFGNDNYNYDSMNHNWDNYDSRNNYWDDYDNGQQYKRDKECCTPNGEIAKCIPLNYCPVLKRYSYYHNHEESNFLKESLCGHTYSGPLVCCGTKYKYTKFEPRPTFTNTPFSSFTPNEEEPAPSNQRRTTIKPTVEQEVSTKTDSSSTSTQPGNIEQSTPTSNPNQNPILGPTEASNTVPSSVANIRRHTNFNLLPSKDICGLQGLDDKIFGGIETGLNEFPWMALLEYHLNGTSTGYKCGGMLINDKYILTAAHCVSGNSLPSNEKLLRVRLGEHDLNTTTDCRMGQNNIEDCNLPPQDIDIEDIIVNPGYSDTNQNMHNDIALLRLSSIPVQSDFVRPICLPVDGEATRTGQNLMISGWGVVESKAFSMMKMKAIIPYVEDEQCKRIWARFREISDRQFCAGGSGGVGVCRGDSGGPIMSIIPGTVNWYAEGLVSYGRLPCGSFPNVFTRISSYINWILDNIKP